jgi:hypothetical protein
MSKLDQADRMASILMASKRGMVAEELFPYSPNKPRLFAAAESFAIRDIDGHDQEEINDFKRFVGLVDDCRSAARGASDKLRVINIKLTAIGQAQTERFEGPSSFDWQQLIDRHRCFS